MANAENSIITEDPTLEEMSTWTTYRLSWRAFILAAVRADRRTRKDETWAWADRELEKIVPLVNERFEN